MAKSLCIYHANCVDGFAAAWVLKTYGSREFDFHPGVYQEEPPDVTGRDVYLVDFSYPRAVVEKMLVTASRIILIDHHKTAIEDLKPLIEDRKILALVDVNHSGAMLAWIWCNGKYMRGIPPLLKHIEDRDLWLFKLDGTREIQASLFSYPYDFDVWDRLMGMDPQVLRCDGIAIERKHHKDVSELVSVTKRRMIIGGYDVPVANLPYTLSSDAGNLMAQNEHFAACYYDTPNGRCFSLRSTDAGVDVSEVAACYGGGGHRNAAGFRVPFTHSLAAPIL